MSRGLGDVYKRQLQEGFDVSGDISLQMLAGMPDVLKSIPDVDDEEEMTKCILAPVKEACVNLEKMRGIEGEKLAADLVMRGDIIKGLVDQIEERADLVPKAYTEKLRERIKELIGGSVAIPEDRILVEAAIFADKSVSYTHLTLPTICSV